MNKYTKRLLGIAFFLAVFLLTLYSIFKDQSLSSLISTFKNVDPLYLVIGSIMMILFIYCDALKLKITLHALNQKTSIIKTMGYAFIGFYFNAITPSSSGGQVAQVYYMNKDDINVSHSSLTLLVTTIVYQVTIIFYAILMYCTNYLFVSENLSELNWVLYTSLVLNILVVGCLISLMFSKKFIRTLFFGLINLLCKIRLIKDQYRAKSKVLNLLDEYNQSANYIKKHPKVVLRVFFVTFVQLTILFMIPYLVYRSFSLSDHTSFQIITMQSLLTLAITVLPLPGGMGASENAFLIMFRLFYTSSLLIPAMLISRFISFYGLLFVSGIVTVIVHFLGANKKVKLSCNKISKKDLGRH
ncbi:MAG TPA: lysylphosphatidylglycerol synthetase family protein [Firmicutes bacterium]|nr:lysylphosphatidylglycerol synthetase family protein [Bacillota bacterium]